MLPWAAWCSTSEKENATKVVHQEMDKETADYVKWFKELIYGYNNMSKETDYTEFAENIRNHDRVATARSLDVLMTEVPRWIHTFATEILDEKDWLKTKAGNRAQQLSIENAMSSQKFNKVVSDAFIHVILQMRRHFDMAPLWGPGEMKLFLNSVAHGKFTLRNTRGAEPVVDLVINVAWRTTYNEWYESGMSSEALPLGIFLPTQRFRDLDTELLTPWLTMRWQ